MPTERPVINESVKISEYALEVSPAMSPLPCKFSTPMPPTVDASPSPTMASSAKCGPKPSEVPSTRRARAAPEGNCLKSSSDKYKYSKPRAGSEASFHLMRSLGINSSTRPTRAPLLHERWILGNPWSRAYRVAFMKKESSATPKEPALCVTSFATRIIERPSGYSGVLSINRQAIMPMSLRPGARSISLSSPFGSITSSMLFSNSFGTDPPICLQCAAH
mmetsp:Transcript_44000/g.110556  ORF Transcript_44000/g.110556 Transcript_44000/m.110556 type:complete len:220 (+) Transcript_44000:1822-2481(+)